MRSLGDAIHGVLSGSILWIILYPGALFLGFKFLNEPRWTLASYCLITGAVVVEQMLLGPKKRRRAVQYPSDVASVSAELGLTYVPTVERPSIALKCFEKWHQGAEGSIGDVNTQPVRVFDLTEKIDDGECTSYPVRTLVLLPIAGLPAFSATPRSAGRFAHLFGLGGMTFDPANLSPDDAECVIRFSRIFRIELRGNPGPLTPSSPELKSRDEAVHRVVTPKLMAFLLENPKWSFECAEGWLVCWRGQTVCEPHERPQMIQTALEIRDALLAAAAEISPVVLPSKPPLSGGTHVVLVGFTMMGMLLGGFGAFFSTMFGTLTLGPSGLLMLLPFLIAFVGAFAGGAMGYGLGVVFGRIPNISRWIPRAMS